MARLINLYALVVLVMIITCNSGFARHVDCEAALSGDSLRCFIDSSMHGKKGLVNAIIFMDVADCEKCLMGARKLVGEYQRAHKKTVRLLALVTCTRQRELATFKDYYNWDGPLFMDDGRDRKRLGLTADSRLVFFDRNWRVLQAVSYNDVANPSCHLR